MAFHAIQLLVGHAIGLHPERVAVECPHGQMTYAELDARAADIAGALRAVGAHAGAFIPILTGDRRELTAAILAILRIGAVFVPLDVTAARPRLEHMLHATSPSWAVIGSGAEKAAAVLAAAAPDAVRIVAGAPGIGAAAAPYEPGPDDPCYVFFTSGSTGRPKGIVGRLKGIDHFVRWESELLGVEPGWRVSQLTSPSFDAVLRDLFVPLTTGGTVCVPPSVLDAAELARWIDEERIDLVHCVPSVLRRVLREAVRSGREFRSLRCVAVSGERLAPDDAACWLDRYGERIKLLNLYGPTETTMTKTYHFVTGEDLLRPSIPVGRPLPGTEVLLLDGRGEPSAPGAVGEICLRTPYRTLGYLNEPEATARAFVAGPRGPDDVMYRTGDFGRLLPGGELEFVGRTDHQVKIGGVRVELEGVESVLREHPAVLDAAVVATEGDGVDYLAAFVELIHDIPVAALRRHAAERLPGGAVPEVFVTVEEFPRTISGKIDRRALPSANVLVEGE